MTLKHQTLLLLLATVAALSAADRKEVDVNADIPWTDSGIDLNAGDSLAFSATGSVAFVGNAASPDGLGRGFLDLLAQLPLNSSGRGALLGKIGSSAAARPFLIGSKSQRTAPAAGRLFLGINQMASVRGVGSHHVVIERTAAAAPEETSVSVNLAPFTQQMLDSIPTRVNDARGNAGDRVNFVLVGSEDKVQKALSAAGWVVVDKDVKSAVIHAVLGSFSRDAYINLPMSALQLFGRVQDYGYAQGDPLLVVASRHHFRIWKAPFTVGGETVWAGAGTHDIGFDRDSRNNGVTHKIDPATDGERDYIGESLKQTGLVVMQEYLTPANPVTEARTATGSSFTSDGRTSIIYLQPEGHNFAADFAAIFCSVLASNPDGGEWASCSQYLDGAAIPATSVPLPALTSEYRVVIVPGFLSSCFSTTPAFQKGQQRLRDQGFAVDLIPVPNDATSANANLIAQFLRQQTAKDPRKIILVGYSKGSPDIYEALTANPALSGKVAAFVSVAGAVGGSAIADTIPDQAERWIKQFKLTGCEGDINSGFKSLGRRARQVYLNANPRIPGVPAYSIVAQSSLENTSSSLLQTWRILSAMGPSGDGQLLKPDAILPDSKYLGAALADHFAIALPFEDSTDTTIRKGMDRNHYPRTALLESIIRFVEADLKSQAPR